MRDTITVLLEVVQEFTADSLALIALYNATDGSNWNVPWNLDTIISTWHGVTINDGRVTEVDLSNNLPNNFLAETLPESIKDLTNLQSLNLSNNSLESLPALNTISSSTSIDVSTNNLDFSSIIPNLLDENDNPRGDNFIYNSQAILDTRDTIVEKLGNNIELTINNDYETNNYQWYKDGTKIEMLQRKIILYIRCLIKI